MGTEGPSRHRACKPSYNCLNVPSSLRTDGFSVCHSCFFLLLCDVSFLWSFLQEVGSIIGKVIIKQTLCLCWGLCAAVGGEVHAGQQHLCAVRIPEKFQVSYFQAEPPWGWTEGILFTGSQLVTQQPCLPPVALIARPAFWV